MNDKQVAGEAAVVRASGVRRGGDERPSGVAKIARAIIAMAERDMAADAMNDPADTSPDAEPTS